MSRSYAFRPAVISFRTISDRFTPSRFASLSTAFNSSEAILRVTRIMGNTPL
jgi:hypothetical protein